MIQPAQRLSNFSQSIIRQMTRLAYQHDAINMAQGFPDFGTPPELIAAAQNALMSGHNQYTITWGVPELRQQIATTMHNLYQLDYDPNSDITVTCGVTEAIMAAVLSIVNKGDEVIIIEPFHENYIPAVTFAQAKPIFVPLEPPHFALDCDRIRDNVSQRTRAIILNTPHNPTGRVFTHTELQALADLCIEFDLILITDEIYDRLTYDGRDHIPPATLDSMRERTITTSGLGKTFAVTGWRLGYACCPEPLSSALRTVHDFLTICAPTPLQHAAIAALNMPESYFEQQRTDYHWRREQMYTILSEANLNPNLPEGAYYMLSDISASGLDDFGFVERMTKKVGVTAVPGSAFYRSAEMGSNLVRWAFPKKMETFAAVASRLQKLYL